MIRTGLRTRENSGVFDDGRGRLSLGLVLTIVVVAFEGLAVATIMPITALALRGLALYAWSFSGFMLGSLVGTVAVGEYAERHGPGLPLKGALAVFSCGLLACGAARTMPVFIAGRVVEGLGTGALRSLVWLVGRLSRMDLGVVAAGLPRVPVEAEFIRLLLESTLRERILEGAIST